MADVHADNFELLSSPEIQPALKFVEDGKLWDALISVEEALVRAQDKDMKASLEILQLRSRLLGELGYTGAEKALAHLDYGLKAYEVGNFPNAIRNFRWALAFDPACLLTQVCLSELFACAYDSSQWNGMAARVYALDACEQTRWKNWWHISALSGACARSGDFAEAVRLQKMVLAMAPADELGLQQKVMSNFLAGQPWVEYPDNIGRAQPTSIPSAQGESRDN